MKLVRNFLLVSLLTGLFISKSYSQCIALGQNPSTAFPVCGTTTFSQSSVPICSSNNLFVPGCQDGANYANKNPFWYKFTCYVAGSLGFVITPNNLGDDYDWQLYDITGLNPNDVYTNTSIIISGNWSGSSGLTGASSAGVSFIQCASLPQDNRNTFAQMPSLIVGHEYLLLVSHYTDSQSGYSLSFAGGTAVITDPAEPHLQKATPDCDGTNITVKLNKRMKCNSLTTTGTEFSISPAASTVIRSVSASCTSGFDFDSLTITLSAPLPPGNYDLVINNGSDGNTLLDNCGRGIPENEKVSFRYDPPQPIFADSVGRVGCAPQSVKVYWPKKINCSTIALDGSDFAVTGPSPVTIVSANGNCTNGETNVITVNFAAPISVKGTYVVTLKTGNDGGTVTDICGLPSPIHTRTFVAADTVSAVFTFSSQMDCSQNTLTFTHNGAHDVNSWDWLFNDRISITNPSHTIVFPSSSTNTIRLIVSNGTCSDTVSTTIEMNNEVNANFEMPDIICPEDPLVVKNTSTGLIDSWQWKFGTFSNAIVKDPAPVQFPAPNIEANYQVQLICRNNALGCNDTITKILKVLDNCFIAVPSAFTPNNDGLNDFLYPNNAIKAENLNFRIYNRWGQLVFQSRDWTKKWNGKLGGLEQASGVYVWVLEYTHRDTGQKIMQKGTTTLIR